MMKKWIIAAIAALTIATPAQADSFGVHFTYPLTVGAQYTFGDPSPDSGAFRVWITAILGSGFGLSAQLDALFNRIPLSEDGAFGAYYGLGGHIAYATASSGSYSASAILLGAQGTGGIDFTFGQNLSLFLEGSVGYSLGIVTASSGSNGLTLPVGGNYYRIGAGLNFKL